MRRAGSLKERIKEAEGERGPLHFALEIYRHIKWRIYCARMQGKTRQEAFQYIYKNDGWGYLRLEDAPDDFYSGPGSYAAELVEPYVILVKELVAEMGIKTIVDLGCGDFNVGSRIAPLVDDYTGCDIVPELVARNNRIFSDDGCRFVCLDMVDDNLPPADLCLIREALQHLSNEEVLQILPKLRQYKFVLITEGVEMSRGACNSDVPHGSYRGISLEDPPFSMAGTEMLRLEHPHTKNTLVVSTLFSNPREPLLEKER
ncbi:MAG TPA: hypothetical protein DCP91_00255 [Eggerthellaceae bacterium]|nr:hypothetical protein [Eggerthellaceae bacterium]